MPADAWRGDELQEEKVEFIVDSGCTHPTCTAATASKLTNLRPGEYLGAFQTPDGSQSTPKRAGDLVGTIGSTTTIPLVVSDIAVQHMYRVNLLPEDVLTDHGITIVNSPRVGKCLILPDHSYQRLRREHGLHCLSVLCKPPSHALAMTRAQRLAAAPPAPKGATNGKSSDRPTPSSVANDTKQAVVVQEAAIRPEMIERLVRLHFKLCHCNFQKLKHYLECNGMLHEFNNAELRFFLTRITDICCFCGMSKYTRVRMLADPGKEVSILFPGERVSCDVMGKFVPAIGGMVYSWTFYDWCTEKPRFYPVHAKSEFVRVLKQYQIDAGLRKGGKIIGPVRLISDTGSEFLSAAARDHYRECGTLCTASPPGRQEWNGRIEGMWSFYLRTMFTIFAANPTMPLKLWSLLLVHLANVFSAVPKTRKSGPLITPHEAETGIKPPISVARAPFFAPMICENFRKTGGKFERLPGRLGFYCGQCTVTPVADYVYVKDTDSVIVAHGAKPVLTEVNSNEVWIAKFAPDAVQAIVEPRPQQALPRQKHSAEAMRAVLQPDDSLEPPADLEKLCGQLPFVSRFEHTDTDQFDLDDSSTVATVGGNSDVDGSDQMKDEAPLDVDSDDAMSTQTDDDADGADTLGGVLDYDGLNSTLNLDDFNVVNNMTEAYSHTMTPHRAPIHLDYGTHMAIKGNQYQGLNHEQLCDRCEAAGLKPQAIVKSAEPSAVVHSIRRQLAKPNPIGLMHRTRKDYESLALRAALINHDNQVFSQTNVAYGGRGDDSPNYVNLSHHLTVPEAVHAVIDDHAQHDVGCDYAEGLLMGRGNQPLIKEVERDRAAKQQSAEAVASSMPPTATRSAAHKVNVTTEVGRSLKELKKKNNAHYDDHVRAMEDELEKVKTFEVFEDVLECDITNKAMIVNSILLFAEKYGKNNEFVKAKCRLAAQGFTQQEGLSYFDTYAATPQDATWRYMMSLAASHNFEVLKQIDWTSAFFMPILQEAVYLRMPAELREYNWNAVQGKYFEVYKKCRRAIYGLKQSGRKFSDLVAADFDKLGYHRSFYDPSVHVKWQPKKQGPGNVPLDPDPARRRAGFTANDPRRSNVHYDPDMPYSTGMSLETHDLMMVAVHVDDYVVIGTNMTMYDELVQHLKSEYKITEGDLDFYLGMSVDRDVKERTISLGQEALLEKLAEKFDWLKPMAAHKTYNVPVAPEVDFSKESMPAEPSKQRIDDARSIIGTMLYLSMKTRPDLAQATSMMSRVVSNPSEEHLAAMKQMCVYAYNTRKQKLVYRGREHVPGTADALYAFADSDFNNVATNYKATSGYAIYHNHNLIDWKSKLQATISRSTCQAELAALSFVSCQIIHLRYLLQEMGLPLQHATVVREDNKAAVFATENEQMSRRLGHLKVAELFCRRAYQMDMIKAMPIKSEHNVADVFTKACAKVKFGLHKDQLFNGPKW